MACDIQDIPEKMNYHIEGEESIKHNARRLATLAKHLNIPIIATYMAKFGPLT